MKTKILVADDDPALRRIVEFKLTQNGYEVVTASDGAAALSALKSDRFDLILSDMKMPRTTGIELLEQAKKIQPDVQIIMMTAFAAIPQAVQAIKLGAFDYLTKPFEEEQLLVAIQKAVRYTTLEKENRQLKEQIRAHSRHGEMIGVSVPFKNLISLIEKVAPTDATVLIAGESGTGKELVARMIHRKSSRNRNEFVAINCAAIPKELIESELFGHVKGAFTGAVRDKKGKFELADGGTILLDEISELPFELQAKLLRVLQERALEPVGSERRVEIDVRLLAATNVDLARRVADGLFREDLYYRLNVIPIRVPSLRERIDDVALLVKEFLARFAPGESIRISDDLMRTLKTHHWPGNIRELENLIERLVILRTSDELTVSDLPSEFGKVVGQSADNAIPTNERITFHEAEKRLVLDALERSGWNKARAAKYLSIPRHILLYRMKKYNLGDAAPR